jgi:hypothetical protein
MPALIVSAGAIVAGTVLGAVLSGAWWASGLLAAALAVAAWLALPRGRFERPSLLVLIGPRGCARDCGRRVVGK